MEREGEGRYKRRMTRGGRRCWLVWSRRYGDDECGEIGTVLQNLDDQAEYSVLGDAFGV
jgi:hypothetical protein